jgi:hypothetical protein
MQIETCFLLIVTPAHAGVQGNNVLLPWIPASAGMTIQTNAIVR